MLDAVFNSLAPYCYYLAAGLIACIVALCFDILKGQPPENYKKCMFVNATSKDAPQVVDRRVQRVTDPMMVYSGCYCNVTVNFYPFNINGNRGVAAGLGNVQFVRDGERLSGRASAESEFDVLEDADVLGGAEEELPDYLK